MRDEYDFPTAKRAKDVPHLAKLQEEVRGKSRITIMLDNVRAFLEEESDDLTQKDETNDDTVEG